MVMKSVIKLRRTSARDAPKEDCGEELLFPSVGGRLLHWLAELCPPACGEEPFTVCGRGQGQDVGRMTGGQLFPLSSKKSLSSSVKKYPW